jgi:hypothetical protein
MDTTHFTDCYHNGIETSLNVGQTSLHVDRFPFDEPNDLLHSYTIVVASQRSSGHNIQPLNNMINHMVPGLVTPWRGNVLVFKHGPKK